MNVKFDWHTFAGRLIHPDAVFFQALAVTVGVAITAQLLGTALGVLSAVAARSKFALPRAISRFYVSMMRGTPALVQLFFLYYGLPILLGINLFPRELNFGIFEVSGALVAGTLALSLNEGAFMSEIVRAGIESIDVGQLESSLSVGMTPRLAMRRIILPQAARVIIPPLGNEFNGMLKNTSLLAFIGVYEIFLDTQVGYSRTFKPAEYFLAVALWYWLLTTLWGFVQRYIEQRLSVGVASSDRGRRGK